MARSTGRREFVALASAAAVATTLAAPRDAAALTPKVTYSATPPEGFSPFAAPGRVIKVSKAESLQANKLYPKPEDAKDMLTRALTELTGKATLVEAIKLFVHPKDKLVVKVNGIAQKNISTNAELVLPLIQAAIDAGVPADQITVLEQYHGFLNATRITANNVPKGVKLAVHSNKDSTMPDRKIPGTNGVSTKFATTLTDCTAVFNVALVKDHSICGYTGALKNMTHGTTMNPHDFHSNHASPQIAMLYAQDVIKSRVRLHIADAFKVMYHGGPLDKKPECRVPYEAVFASTDPVAMDTIGWGIVEEFRKKNGLKTLTAEGRAPAYIKAAAELGLGVHDREHIDLREVTI
ncbi:MAG: DUF362 domain-containing protein [Polyangiaceae bacterium]